MKTAMKLPITAAIAVAVLSTVAIATSAVPQQESERAISYAGALPAVALRTVSSGDFTIRVPAGWALRSLSLSSCTKESTSSEVITGPMGATISQCGAPSVRHGTFAVFVHGGPPAAPILAGQASQLGTLKINGIWVTTLAGVNRSLEPRESYLLALLDGWTNWLLFVSPGADQAVALRGAETVLRSVHVTPGHKALIERPTPQDFVGTWSHGPDQSITVSSGSAGREDIGPAAGCEGGPLPLGCHITLVLKLVVSSGSSLLTATVTKIKAYDSAAKFVVDPPLTKQLLANGALPVGAKLTFEGVAPGMFVQATVTSSHEFPVEWPYWCDYYRQTPTEREITDYCS